ncbi:hypothetical protein POVCU1_056220, partial [Plasmodium ovale curtisi]
MLPYKTSKILSYDNILTNHRILPTLSCNHEETSRRIQVLSDKCNRQLFPQEQASGHEPGTQLDQASATFLEGKSAPQSDESITRHSQIITGDTKLF